MNSFNYERSELHDQRKLFTDRALSPYPPFPSPICSPKHSHHLGDMEEKSYADEDLKTKIIQEQATKIQEMEKIICEKSDQLQALANKETKAKNDQIAQLEVRIEQLKAIISYDTERFLYIFEARDACKRRINALRGPGKMQPNFTYKALTDYEVAKEAEAAAQELINILSKGPF